MKHAAHPIRSELLIDGSGDLIAHVLAETLEKAALKIQGRPVASQEV
ncbi:MAG: hypothetical protein AMXMBFR13_03370 [Phycisphaerae bacterium]